jgi:hypothetical protein
VTGPDDRLRSGRFGAASPGLRPERQSLEDLLTARQRPPTRKRRLFVVLICVVAALAIGGGGYLAGRLTAPGPPAVTRILVTDTALPQGARLTAADLTAITVRRGDSAPAGSLGPSAVPSLIGLAATAELPSGTIVTRSLLAPPGAVPAGARVLVGLALKPGQLPAGGLADGQYVSIVFVPSSNNAPAIMLGSSTVWDVQGSAAAGMVTAIVVVPAADATQLAGYASRGEVALVVTPAPGSSSVASVTPSTQTTTKSARPPSTQSHSKSGSKPKPSHSS